MRRATIALFALALALTAVAAKHRAVRHPGPEDVIARADSYSVVRGGTLVRVATAGVLANDTELQSKPLTAILVSATTHGTLALNVDGSFTYVNDGSAATSDAFTYKASNGTSESSATVAIAITDPPPSTADDNYTTVQNTPLNQPAPGVFANDALNGGTLAGYGAATATEQTVVGATTATEKNGTVLVNADGSFTYTPASNFIGTDTFRYRVGNTTGNATATATIAVSGPVGPDFTVTSPGFFYTFSGVSGQNPKLTLKRGRTYVFEINADPIHPFQILNAPPGSVDNNNIFEGTLTFTVPNTAANYRYHCSIHDFGNTITTVP